MFTLRCRRSVRLLGAVGYVGVHQIARHRIIHDAHVLLRRGGPPTASHGAPACNYSLLSASDDGTSGQGQWTPAVPSIYTATMPGYATNSVGLKRESHDELFYRRKIAGRVYTSLELCLWEPTIDCSCFFWGGGATGIPSLDLRRRLRASCSLQYARTILDKVWLPAGTKKVASAAGSRGGSRPQLSTENHPRSLVFPIARSPSPSNKYLTALGPVATPKIEKCDAVRRQHLQAGSLGRNAKYQHHTPTHSALQIANSIHAASHLQSHFRSSILRLFRGGYCTLSDSIWGRSGAQNGLVDSVGGGRCREVSSHMTA